MIEVITNSGIKYEESEAKIDMCQAIQDMRRESEQDGERKGRQMQARESARSKSFDNS